VSSTSSDISMSRTAEPRLKPEPGAELPPGQVFTDHSFYMRWSKRRAWQGLTIADRDTIPSLRPAAAALNYGQTLIEDLKAYRMNDGTVSVYRPDSHLKRLNKGTQRMALPLVDFDRVWGALKALAEVDEGWLAQEAGSELSLRLVLAANGKTLAPGPATEALFYILASPSRGATAAPQSALSLPQYVRAWPDGTGDIGAAGNYAAAVVPAEVAVNYGYGQVLWLDGPQRRFVQQVGEMNVFFVIDGVLTTPALEQSIFPGITRDSLIKLARDGGQRVDERPVELAEVLAGIGDGRVTECFATGTAAGVVPLDAIGADPARYPLSAAPGPVTTYFRDLLDGIHRGDLADRFGWMRRLTEVATVRV
jgi:branched-chain amino acid aminotransferase